MSRWVRHKSGQGEKWKVRDCSYNANLRNRTWVIDCDFKISSNCMELPRSEYILTDPPEEWQDVTGEFHATEKWPSMTHSMSNGISGPEDKMFWIPSDHHDGTLMLRKVDVTYEACKYAHAFIVERRKA